MPVNTGFWTWATQQQMALLYGKAPSTINEHIGDIFYDKELLPEACRKKFGNSEFQQTAAEIIYSRADAEKEFMGLTTFKGSRPHLSDAVIAKNYLNEKELRSLGQLASGYLDFAERKAERHEYMTMADWAKHLDNVLSMNGEQLLVGSGSVSHKEAVEKAADEYKKYQQRTLSDVERAYLDTIKMLESKTMKKS